MSKATLWRNRDRLIAWQREQYTRPAEAGVLRLHLGSGRLRYPGYLNVDLYEPSADFKIDMCDLAAFADNSVDDISCHHALEHVPLNRVEPALREWHRVLKPGGRLDLGLPDIELLASDLQAAPEAEKWAKFIYQIYGLQSSIYDTNNLTYEPGQVHQSGISAARLRALLESIGFKVLEIFNYDANGCASSVWVLAEKRDPCKAYREIPSVLEQDVAMGVFTHRTTYLMPLLESAKTHLPHIPMHVVLREGTINENMARMRQEFLKSGKRYWLYLDDDIQFLNRDVVHNAMVNLIANGWGACGVYSTFDPEWIKRGYREQIGKLAAHEIGWVTGYFILVDSKKVGHIEPDMNLPDGNTSVDTTYSVAIRAAGYKCGISPDVVYHKKKEGSWVNQAVIEPTNKYLMSKWGQFYFDHVVYPGNVLEWGI